MAASSSTTDVIGNPAPGPADSKGPVAPHARDDQPTVISHVGPVASLDVDLRPDRLSPGDRLEHFEVVELIGGGGMARVYRALDTRLARTVAVKVLTRDQAADPETRQRFQKEAQSTAQLDHENIARVYYVGEERGLPFIAFEYIEGTDIRAMVDQQGPLPVAEAVSYTLQVAEALSHAAGRNVVHRDIKPSNILITPEGRAKLIDMGLARMHRGSPQGSDLTASGVTLGTFDYISPEQARDPRNADVRSDIYSLGCAFFFMLVGRPPFPEGTVLQKLLQHQGDDPPDPRGWRPGLPDELIRVLRRMLAKDPRQRYQEAGELVSDLLALAEVVGLSPAGFGRTVWITPREPRVSYLERHLPWIAPVTALVCMVLLLDFLWSPAGGPGEPVPPGAAGPGPESQSKPASPNGPGPGVAPEAGAADTPGVPGGAGAAGPEAPAKPGPKPGENPSIAPPAGDPKPPAAPAAKPNQPSTPAPAENAATTGAAAPALRPDGLRGMVSGSEPFGSGLTAGETGPSPPGAAAGPGPGDEAGTSPTSGPLNGRTGVLTVADRPTGEGAFASLAAACSVARSGDVIELRYNGRRDEAPVRLSNVSLTIRAGEGFQPEIVFRPKAEDKDPVKYPRSMFRLTGGELSLYNLALTLDVPRDLPAEKWSLFEPGQAQTVQLAKCVLSIRNASDQLGAVQPDVTFFRVRAPSDGDAAAPDGTAGSARAVVVEMSDCVARGEAWFVRAEDVLPLRLTWTNGLLATTERLLAADGGQRTAAPSDRIEIDLRHLTAVAMGGLCRLASTEVAPHLLETEIRCRDSIVLTSPGSSLIEQAGPMPADALKQRFQWVGDWNFYQGFTTFWSIRPGDADNPPEVLEAAAWQAHWGPQREILPKFGQVVWRRPPDAARPMHSHAASEYVLAETPGGNPARRAARDGQDVGLQLDQLPQPPAPPEDAGAAETTRGD